MKQLRKTVVSFALVIMMAVFPVGETQVVTTVRAETMVYVTRTGSKYHTHKCGNGTFYQTTLSSAKARGLTPCSKCYSGSSGSQSGSTSSGKNNSSSSKTTKKSKLTISSSKLLLVKGKSKKLTAKCGSQKVKWKSSNKKVAAVSANGRVTAKGKGKATITASCGNQKKTCKVTVEDPKLSKSSLTMETGDTATLELRGCSHDVTWESTDSDVCDVDDGKLEALESGTATIQAKVHGMVFKCRVVVTDPEDGDDGDDEDYDYDDDEEDGYDDNDGDDGDDGEDWEDLLELNPLQSPFPTLSRHSEGEYKDHFLPAFLPVLPDGKF